jgi:hypothetical protein
MDAGAILPVTAGHGLRRIVQNLHMIHPGLRIGALDYRPGTPNQLARDVRLFRALKRMGIHNAAGTSKNDKAVFHERSAV